MTNAVSDRRGTGLLAASWERKVEKSDNNHTHNNRKALKCVKNKASISHRTALPRVMTP